MSVVLGAIGERGRARIDEHGTVRRDRVALTWSVGADDGWHVPDEDRTTRQRRPGPAPIVETAVRVPGGDVLHRAYGVTGATVIEVENASPEACALAFVAHVHADVQVHLEETVLSVGGAPAVVLPRPPRLWAGAPAVREVVVNGGASAAGATAWQGPVEVALLVPVPHRTSYRIACADAAVEVGQLPDAAQVARAWEQHLDCGLRVELPEPWASETDAARADLLLADPSAEVVAALEDWGFDAEVRELWPELGFRARRAARRRPRSHDAWPTVRVPAATPDAAAFLLALRRVLVDDTADRDRLDLLPGFPPEWLGAAIAAHELPLRTGTASFALRWHGARPALLWDTPPGVIVRAPALDPEWSGAGGTGEALLAEPPAPLLAMGAPQREGARLDDPGSFT